MRLEELNSLNSEQQIGLLHFTAGFLKAAAESKNDFAITLIEMMDMYIEVVLKEEKENAERK